MKDILFNIIHLKLLINCQRLYNIKYVQVYDAQSWAIMASSNYVITNKLFRYKNIYSLASSIGIKH